jgi:uncharacterized cupin superfamily protein
VKTEHPNLVSWDAIDPVVSDRQVLRGLRWRLGAAAGAARIGLSRYVLGPDERAMPVHVHADEEEHFHVLEGSGLSWQNGQVFEVAAGDTIVHRAQAEAHTIIAGPDGLDVLAFGTGSDTGMTWLPRAQSWWMGPHWLPHDGPNPFAAEIAAGELELPEPEPERPANIVAFADVEEGRTERDGYRERWRVLAAAAGSVKAGLNHGILEPGQMPCPPHRHAIEEECFVVLGGSGEAWIDDANFAIQRGSVLVCPPSGIAHTICAGPDGLEYLVFGTRVPGDYAWFPRSRKLSFRNGIVGRLVEADYFDGE